MLRSVVVGTLAVITAAAMPVFLMSPMQFDRNDDRLLIIQTTKEPKSLHDNIQLQTSGKILSIPLEEYLVGVLISEMPLSFHEEALKAQAVAARTFAVKQVSGGKHEGFDLCDQASCCQAWNKTEDLEKKLGDGFSCYMNKAVEAVRETEDQLIYYHGELIDAVYFSCSGGATEAAVSVWGSNIPYLQSVESPGEERSSKYRSSVSYSADAFRTCINRSDLTGNPPAWFGGEERSEGGGVKELEIGGIWYSGAELRSLLGLNSTWFTIDASEEEIVIDVQGYGHRVGMSQYGANAMAESGSTFEEILAYYYQGVEIK